MKYIIMCGRSYAGTDLPKQLFKIGDSTVVGRTIALLRKFGAQDIAISTNDDRFQQCGVPLLKHENTGAWINGFYPTDVATCYIFGDVVFSERAIQTIVETQTDSVEFFASAPPFSPEYPKKWAEPFAFKVVDINLFRSCIDKVRDGIAKRIWRREPIAWELWQVIKNTEYNKIVYTNYTVINDYTCDIDYVKDLDYYKNKLDLMKVPINAKYMIHACPKRMWYVEEFLVPSLLKQGIDFSAISVYNDSKREGNLRACMHAFESCEGDGGTWHLQDDVCICEDFKQRTEQFNNGLVCGFSSKMYDGSDPEKVGIVPRSKMWFSFPCIRIPNDMARACADWAFNYVIGNPVYEKFWKNGVNDDWMFRAYLKEFHKDCTALNINPNLVNHIDYLIGGGTGASKRREHCVAQYWKDDSIVRKLEESINGR